MKAIIPTAGIGKRLRPLTLTLPKVLLPVAGKPILGHILDRIVNSGIDEICLVVGYRGDQVIEYVQAQYPIKTTFVEQKVRKGLGHAVEMGLEEKTEPVLIILGDTILDMDYSRLLQSPENILGVMEVEDPRRFGIVELDDARRATRLVEKPANPKSNLAIAGIYLMQNQRKLKEAIQYIVKKEITTKGEYQLTDALQVMLERQEAMMVEVIDAVYDCGTRRTLLETNRHLLQLAEQSRKRVDNSIVVDPVSIHPEAHISESVVGPYVSIGAGTQVRRSVITNSIICEHARLESVILEDSLIGRDSRLKGQRRRLDLGAYSRM